jgi:hypothetical protein
MMRLFTLALCAFVALSMSQARAQTAVATPPASPWTWPAIPPCLGGPSISTPVTPKAPPLPLAHPAFLPGTEGGGIAEGGG